MVDIDNMPWTELSMSNLDDSIDKGLEEKLKNGYWCNHAAYNYNGTVWYEDDKFHENVYQYHALIESFQALTLRELMDKVQERFGSE